MKPILTAILLAASLSLAACSGGPANDGPSRDELFRACLDGGAKATNFYGDRSRNNPRAVCDCVVDIFQRFRHQYEAGAAESLLTHWQNQSTRSFGLTLFPVSVSSDPAFIKPGFAGGCQIDFY